MKKGIHCPLLNKKCIENKCAWFCQVRGINPNTGDPVDEWQCAVNLMPILLIENSQQQRSTAAAVESFRNEAVRNDNVVTQLLAANLQGLAVQDASIEVLTEGKTPVIEASNDD